MKILILLSLTFLVSACTKISVENYDKLKAGMPYTEVKQLLGTPTQCSEVLSVKHCVWGNEKRHIDVSFVSDQAVVFTAENLH